MKRVISLLLSLILILSSVFSLASCLDGGTKSCEVHADEDKDGKCDKCGEPVTPTEEVIPEDQLGEVISTAVIDQLDGAGSIKIDIVVYSDYAVNSPAGEKTEFSTQDYKFTATLSKTDSGYNAKVDMNATSSVFDGELNNDTKNYTVLYVIDNVMYGYDEELGGYVKSEMTEEADSSMTALIASIIDNIELGTEQDAAEAKKQLGDLFVEAFEIDAMNATYSYDGKGEVENLFTYINEINPDTKTLESLVNDILVMIDPDITVSEIFAEINRITALTVNEAISEIDSYLKEKYSTDLQTICTSVVTSEDFLKAYKDLLTEQGMPADIVNAQVEAIKALKISDLLTQPIDEAGNTVGDIRISSLIAMIFASSSLGGSEQGSPYAYDEGFMQLTPEESMANALAMIEALLPMTLSEINLMLYPQLPILSIVKEYISRITVAQLSESINVKFGDNYKIDEVNGAARFEAGVTVPAPNGASSEVELMLKTDFKIYGISDAKVEITLPSDAVIIEHSAV